MAWCDNVVSLSGCSLGPVVGILAGLQVGLQANYFGFLNSGCVFRAGSRPHGWVAVDTRVYAAVAISGLRWLHPALPRRRGQHSPRGCPAELVSALGEAELLRSRLRISRQPVAQG